MESELERFHKRNTSLELNIDVLRQKLKATDKEMHMERQKVYNYNDCDNSKMMSWLQHEQQNSYNNNNNNNNNNVAKLITKKTKATT